MNHSSEIINLHKFSLHFQPSMPTSAVCLPTVERSITIYTSTSHNTPLFDTNYAREKINVSKLYVLAQRIQKDDSNTPKFCHKVIA